jgi:CBS domain-containing protein
MASIWQAAGRPVISLDPYRRPRLVVLHPACSAFEAARAMADHDVGTVLVGDRHELVGLVTDRDLAIELVTAKVDPRQVLLKDIMSGPVWTIDVRASIDEAVRAMCEHGCRRLPIMEDGIAVGIVTLDDLLLDGAIDRAASRAILIAQMERVFPRQQKPPARPRARLLV